jgi:carboxyl-terminal processing protease
MIRSTSKELDSLNKLKMDLSVGNTTADQVVLDANKDKADKNKVWIKKLSNDIYINESVKVVDQMIGQGALAKANNK